MRWRHKSQDNQHQPTSSAAPKHDQAAAQARWELAHRTETTSIFPVASEQ